MVKLDLFSLRKTFDDQGVMICFNGPFSHSVIEQLGEAIKKHLQSADAPQDSIADVFSVVIEQAQNLKNYTTREDLDLPTNSRLRNGTLIVGKTDEGYIVSSGNLVLSDDVPELKERLDTIHAMDKTELKAFYKKRLRAPREDGIGAGLGLIVMARKASAPLDYSFRDQGDGTSFFNINVVI
jgi:hypothetical protein